MASNANARVRVLAIFCNPRNTDPLRLQSEQRVLQQSLRASASAELEVVPAATIDDLRSALLNQRFDVIHFSGHGCIDGPLQALVRAARGPSDCLALAVVALKTWLQSATDLSPSEAGAERALCTLVMRAASESRGGALSW